jgi:hypothetical protein
MPEPTKQEMIQRLEGFIRKYHVTNPESVFSFLILYLIKENNNIKTDIANLNFKLNQLISLREERKVKEKSNKKEKKH